MLSVNSAPPSTVDFPSEGEPSSSQLPPPSSFQQRPAYLPFRRISLPTAPSMIKRNSVASMQSFDSLPEDAQPAPMMPLVMRNVSQKSAARPSAYGNERRRSQQRLRPINEAQEAKRRKIIHEFWETERSYVDGLELIYSHFLEPIIASLDTPHPLLERVELTSIFSNFIDIWNLHRSFFQALSALLSAAGGTPPPLSGLLLAHFPYLSLYNPFVTAFPAAMGSLGALQVARPAFAAFVARQEADERCGRLKLRDWLLTIVQRCPRYLLLLKDLIGCTDSEDAEHSSLTAVHTLVSKITNTLNTSLHTHSQTLALLALQRNTTGLPFALISPGRNLVRRGPLLQLEAAADPRARDFLLFSDCILWLAAADGGDGALDSKWEWTQRRAPLSAGGDVAPATAGAADDDTPPAAAARPGMRRRRSKSDASHANVRNARAAAQAQRISEGGAGMGSPAKARSALPKPRKAKRAPSVAAGAQEERWIFKGRAELVDVDVVVSPLRDEGDERRFEILSPEASFAVYAESEEARDEWVAAIRTTKASLLISLNAMHPNSTLTASTSNAHLRKTLQALPHLPEEEETGRRPRRSKVEHFVPAIWIPDAKTANCMRCARAFGWRRRRHHCRLCGRCVCSACSGQTFYISDPSSKSSKPARACDTCYDSVFPLLEGEDHAVAATADVLPPAESHSTITTMSGFPSWQSISMPSLVIPGLAARQASALLGVDLGRVASRQHDDYPQETAGLPREAEGNRTPPRRGKAVHRPRSYVQILEDFQAHDDDALRSAPPVMAGRADSGQSGVTDLTSDGEGEGEPAGLNAHSNPSLAALSEAEGAGSAEDALAAGSPGTSPRASVDRVGGLGSAPTTPRRKEDTVRRHKRFSMPAMALQTTPVTAKPGAGDGKKRFSLVLGRGEHGPRAATHAAGETKPSDGPRRSLGAGPAVSSLQRILSRVKD